MNKLSKIATAAVLAGSASLMPLQSNAGGEVHGEGAVHGQAWVMA